MNVDISVDKLANKPMSDQECNEFLTRPGLLRALRVYSSDAFQTVFKRAVTNTEACLEGDPTGRLHARLVAQALREIDHDAQLLNITPPENLNRNSSFYERTRSNQNYNTWNSLLKILNKPDLLKPDDWMTVMKTMVSAVDGDERNYGMQLVNSALCRPDVTIRAIMTFPKIFRAARGDPEGWVKGIYNDYPKKKSALTAIASGKGFFERKAFFKSTMGDKDAVQATIKMTAEIIDRLRKIKIKEDSDALIQAAMKSAQLVNRANYLANNKQMANTASLKTELLENENSEEKRFFDIKYAKGLLESFFEVYGKEAVISAKDENGRTALHHFVSSDKEGDISKYLLHVGFDAGALDIQGNSPLRAALTNKIAYSSTIKVLQAFDSSEKISNEEIKEFSKIISNDERDIPDASSRAFISSARARIAIEELMTQSKNLGSEP